MPRQASPTQQVLELVEEARALLKRCHIQPPTDAPDADEDILGKLFDARQILARQHLVNSTRKASRDASK